MFKKLNERVKNLNYMDIALIKWAVFFVSVIVVKIFPQLLKISFPALVILALACAAKPFLKYWK